MNRPEADLCEASVARCWPLTLVGWLWPESDLWPWWGEGGWTLTSDLGGVIAARHWPLWSDCCQTLTSVSCLRPDADLWTLWGGCGRMPTSDLGGIFSPGEIYRSDFLKNLNHTLVQSSNADSLCFSAKIVPPWSPYCDLALAVHCGSSDCRNSTVNWGGGQGNIFGNTYSFSPFSLS